LSLDFMTAALDYLRQNAGQIAVSIATALLIVLLAYVLGRLLGRLAARAVTRRGGQRGQTLASIVRTVVYIVVLLTGLVIALDHLGLEVATVLAGAGILGLAVGFGAQTLVKDCISGFFLILDNVLSVGDVVEIDGRTGVVEEVGLRMIHVRTFNGQLWYIQNGTIDRVGNYNRAWVRAIVEVGLAYEADVQKGMEAMLRVGEEWARDHEDLVVESPQVQGLMGLNASDVGARLVIKMKAVGEQWGAERELRRRIKERFDAEGVEIPFPRRVVYHRQENDGPALRVSGG